MSSFSIIQQKLEQFIRKYYTNELIRGGILFFSIGLLYLILTLLVEYFLWLDTGGRTVLFWTFVAVEAGLFFRFIARPLAKLFNLQQGLDHEAASRIIGAHFPEVNDKLLNVIQLNQNRRESELLAASIDQKAGQLQPIPFKRAINFKKNVKYLRYAAVPVLLIVCLTWLWDKNWFSTSYDRVVNYDTAYEPPAPFNFRIENETLTAIEGRDFVLQIVTEGKVVPQNARISFGNESYFLKQLSPGQFQYTFVSPVRDMEFRIDANDVQSVPYTLAVIKTPTLEGFAMELDYPSYTGKQDEVLNSTGNSIVPEGTKVRWKIQARNTREVAIKTRDSIRLFKQEEDGFALSEQLFRKFDYTLTTSNENLKDHENLSYTIGVVRDAYPEIRVDAKADSLDPGRMFFLGQISDDYGLSKLQLVYYPTEDPESKQREAMPVNKGNYDQFIYSFPDGQSLMDGQAYEYYFEVFDNDALRGGKAAKSAVYSYRKLTKDEVEQEQLKGQEQRIEDMNKSLDQMKDQEQRLEQITNTNKQKDELNWNDKKELEKFIEKQKQQDQMMKNFSKDMKEELDQFQQEEEEPDPFKEQLQDRLEEQEKQLEENEELLKELERLQDMIDKEELSKKLEDMAKQQKNQQKNLEQLVELTKRYYVTKKAEQLAEKLMELGEEQEKLSEVPEDENTLEKQQELNEKFEEYQEEMEELQEENEGLKEPMDIGQDKAGESEVKEEQKKASDDLKQGAPQDASPKQKKAGQKMKEMGAQMQMQMMAGQGEGMEEDVRMLRQILDNLVTFSFEQEDLMEEFKETEYGSATFGKKLNVQNDLKQNFEHIDDSIFALSLRQPMIGGKINEVITSVSFNLDKSLELLAENRFRRGIASQQYTVTGANELANLLGDLLISMQNQMMMPMQGQGQGQGEGQGQGQGQGKGFQLPDIIKQQQSLNQQMQEGTGQSGQGQGEGQGEGDGQGEGEGQGEGQGQGDGQNGSDGGNGSNGQGDNGRGDKNGENGYSEELNGKLFEIYKQQQQLKDQLEDRLSKEGLQGQGGKLIKEMEGVLQQLLEKGFQQSTLERMLNLQYELLKLDEADFKQGMESRRESKTNRKQYQNTSGLSEEEIKKYFNSNEILNREALPLQRPYKKAVKEYFENQND